MTRGRRLAGALGTLLMLFLAWNGISGGLREFPKADTPGQTVQTVFQLAYGVLAVAVLLTQRVDSRPRRLVRIAWIVAVSLAAGIAPVAWGGTGVVTGIVTFAASATVAWGIVSLLGVAGYRIGRAPATPAQLPDVQSPTVAGATVLSSTQRSS